MPLTAPRPTMPVEVPLPGELNVIVSWEGTPWPDPATAEDAGRRAAHAAFNAAEGQAVLAAETAGAELGLIFADNAFVRALNCDWRGHDTATNVLAFPAMDDIQIPGAQVLLGDVVIARQKLESEAQKQNKPVHHHLMHLVCHGTLHLLHYDHMTDTDADQMESLERTILAQMQIPDPYAPITP